MGLKYFRIYWYVCFCSIVLAWCLLLTSVAGLCTTCTFAIYTNAFDKCVCVCAVRCVCVVCVCVCGVVVCGCVWVCVVVCVCVRPVLEAVNPFLSDGVWLHVFVPATSDRVCVCVPAPLI